MQIIIKQINEGIKANNPLQPRWEIFYPPRAIIMAITSFVVCTKLST